MIVTEKAAAKINLALHVLGRRSDGYHELDSIVAFTDLGDELHVEEAQSTTLTITGPFAAGLSQGDDNLVLRAVAGLRSLTSLPHMSIRLNKNLPVASGIGGGSADAAAALRAALAFVRHRPDAPAFQALALSLGADVPVCLHGQVCRMRGIGENIESCDLRVGTHVVLVNPLVPCATAAVFQKLGLAKGQNHGAIVDVNKPETWRNDLQEPALAVVPEIGDCITVLRGQPGLGAVRMSGSGATCFGLAETAKAAAQVAEALVTARPGWWVRATTLAVERKL